MRRILPRVRVASQGFESARGFEAFARCHKKCHSKKRNFIISLCCVGAWWVFQVVVIAMGISDYRLAYFSALPCRVTRRPLVMRCARIVLSVVAKKRTKDLFSNGLFEKKGAHIKSGRRDCIAPSAVGSKRELLDCSRSENVSIASGKRSLSRRPFTTRDAGRGEQDTRRLPAAVIDAQPPDRCCRACEEFCRARRRRGRTLLRNDAQKNKARRRPGFQESLVARIGPRVTSPATRSGARGARLCGSPHCDG